MPDRKTATAHIRLFQRVNAFVGLHVECTDIGVNVSYNVELSDRTGESVVVIRCACGASASFPAPSEDGQALMSATRRFAVPATLSRRASEQHA